MLSLLRCILTQTMTMTIAMLSLPMQITRSQQDQETGMGKMNEAELVLKFSVDVPGYYTILHILASIGLVSMMLQMRRMTNGGKMKIKMKATGMKETSDEVKEPRPCEEAVRTASAAQDGVPGGFYRAWFENDLHLCRNCPALQNTIDEFMFRHEICQLCIATRNASK